MDADEEILICDCQHPETTKDGFAAISEDCPIHGGGGFIVVSTVI